MSEPGTSTKRPPKRAHNEAESSDLPKKSKNFSDLTELGDAKCCSSSSVISASITKRQSPIDITSDIVCHDPEQCKADSLNINYSMGDCCSVVTSDGGFQVNVTESCTSSFAANHLEGDFQLAQFHAHWSHDGSCGSEHLLDGKALSGEVHFVFFNKKYGTFCNAFEKEDGLAVLGVFLKEGNHSDNYQPLFDAIKKAKGGDKPAPMPNNFVLEQLLPAPEDREFITYPGSLTTPPFSESVMWTVLIHPVEVSKRQMDVLRTIVSANYRDCQDLCGRTIKCSKSLRT